MARLEMASECMKRAQFAFRRMCIMDSRELLSFQSGHWEEADYWMKKRVYWKKVHAGLLEQYFAYTRVGE